MVTNTETAWTNRLAGVMPANFMDNISATFAVQNGILDTMMKMIGRTVIHSADNIFNPFAKYTKATMDYGDTIQEYKSKFLNGQTYNPESDTPFAPVKNKPLAQYSRYNDSTQYQQTIYDNQLKLAFTGQQLFGDFVASQLDTMYQSDALDKWTKWKKYMSNKDIAGFTYDITETTEEGFAKEMLGELKDLVYDFKFPNTKYNANGDTAISGGTDIIMRRKDKNIIDKYLSGVYNLEKLDIDANFIFVDDFAGVSGVEGKDLIAVVADDRAFSYVPRTPEGGAIYNPKGLFTNYFYTVQGIYSVAKFRNIAQIYKATA